jgi:hypothetical protein
MRQTFVDTNGVKWSFDPGQAANLIHRYAVLRAFKENSMVIENRESWFHSRSWLRHFGLASLPPGGEMSTTQGWQHRIGQINKQIEREISLLKSDGWGDLQERLIELRRETERLNRTTNTMFRSVREMNDVLGIALEPRMRVAKDIADISILVIGVIGASTTGPVVVVAALSGGALQAWDTYQDTGNVKKAIISGGTFMVPLGGKYFGRMARISGHPEKVEVVVSLVVDSSVEAYENYFVKEQDILDAISDAFINNAGEFMVKNLLNDVDKFVGAKFAEDKINSALAILDGRSNRTPALLEGLVVERASELIRVEPSTSREAAMGLEGARGSRASGVPFVGTPGRATLVCMAPATVSTDPAARYVMQNVLARI